MESHSCHHPHPHTSPENGESCHTSSKPDWLLWGSTAIIAPLYLIHAFFPAVAGTKDIVGSLAAAVYQFLNQMWWGVAVGLVFVAFLGRVPREAVLSLLGPGNTMRGIARATLAGVAMDMCSHGILLVGMKLYERGASIGQVMAFLIASPWNSFSLTFIMIALIGWGWALTFILLSLVVAFTVGLLAEWAVKKGFLPSNPHHASLPEGYKLGESLKQAFAPALSPAWLGETLWMGINDSKMVLRWLFFGVVLAALLRTFVSPEEFAHYFGPTLSGLAFTLLAATLIEVCSEGSMPIATDLLTRAGAVGNSFAFLMGGVATDYTEVMALKETTRSWKTALFLPLATVPQVALLGWILNSL